MTTRTEIMPRLPLIFDYTNHRGHLAVRTVTGAYLWYGSTEHHPEPQWFIRGYCTDRKQYRDFAVLDISRFMK